MKKIFEHGEANYDVQGKYRLHTDAEGVTYETAKGKKNLAVKFEEVGSLFLLNYCSSNQHYSVNFRNPEGKEIGEIDTDMQARRGEQTIQGHNILETKSILIAFAESKLTKAFPDNLDTLDLKIASSIKEKEIRLREGALIGAKHRIKLSDIRRVKCVGNGTLNSLLVYTKEKKGFLDMPDMRVPVNELTLPILEAAMVRNTGRGVDFSQGNGFDQKTSEYILIRYMNASFFANEDGSVTDDWHRIAYDHIQSYQADIVLPKHDSVG